MQVLELGKEVLDVCWRGHVAFVGGKGQRIGVGGGAVERKGWIMSGLTIGEGFVKLFLQGLDLL